MCQAQALVEGVRGEPWFALAHLPDPAKSNRWRLQMDFDVVPVLRRLRILAVMISPRLLARAAPLLSQLAAGQRPGRFEHL